MTRLDITEYDERGAVTRVVNMDEGTYNLMRTLLPPHILGHYPGNDFYVNDGAPVVRPRQDTLLEGCLLTHLPEPCTIWINDTSYDCADDTAEIEFAYPGIYKIKVESFPYLNWTAEVNFEDHTHG